MVVVKGNFQVSVDDCTDWSSEIELWLRKAFWIRFVVWEAVSIGAYEVNLITQGKYTDGVGNRAEDRSLRKLTVCEQEELQVDKVSAMLVVTCQEHSG